MKIKLTDLEHLTHKVLLKAGYSEQESEVIKQILLYSQVRGGNQGIVKLIGNGMPRRSEGTEPTIQKETPVSALVNGNATHAMVVMDKLVDIAIDKASKSGVGIAGNFNTDESTGAIGYYVNRVAEKGLIGLAFASGAYQLTAPHGSNEAKFSTNPIAYAFPTENDPIVFDMTTSAMAYYGLIEAKTSGTEVADGMGYDKDGNETRNPAEIMAGALKTFGGHKGSGLALMVQIFAGAFVTADSSDNESTNSGNLVIAIDPNIFSSTDEFKKKVSEMVNKIKSARKIEGVEEIFVPGEQSNRLYKAALASGEIEIEENLYNALKAIVE